ncbi:MAG: DNRLRE domain-containing protein [Nitrospira sp.]|nr:MAG: DNRLRE domain-containing protein [Nitrospira sp.]
MFPMRTHLSSVAVPAGPCSFRGHASAAFFGLLLIGLLAGCGSGGSSAESTAGPTTSTMQSIGSAGGTVNLPDGKVSLTIPPAALSADTSITITAMSTASSVGAVYQFGPSGLIFNQPVTVTFSVDPSLLPPGTKVQDLVPSYVDDYLEILTDIQVDSAKSTITGKATHFSSIGLAKSEKVGNVSDFTKAATSFRMPIGDDEIGSDLGEDLGLLDVSSTWTQFNYPKRSFHMSASSSQWYVATAFNRDRWLNNGWAEPSPVRANDKDLACSKDPSLYSLSSRYSCRGSFHPGEDWVLLGGGSLGKPIHAIADGIVLLNQQQTGASFGNILIIGHKLVDGQVIASVYAHMKDPSIYGVGQQVSKGAVIGRIGGTGDVDPHLHFEIARADGAYFKADADGIKIITRTGNPFGIQAIQGWRWPGANTQFVRDNYYDPSQFIKDPSQFITPPSPFVYQPSNDIGVQDIWTTSVFSYTGAGGGPGGGPGGGLNDERLRVGGFGDLYYSVVQFDLSQLPPVGSKVELQLYMPQVTGAGTTALYIDRITAFWDWRTQGTGQDRLRLWWADRPSAIQWIPSSLPAPTAGQWYVIDITTLYNAWQAGTYPNYGIQLRPVTNSNTWADFSSSNSVDALHRPRLVVTPITVPGGAVAR